MENNTSSKRTVANCKNASFSSGPRTSKGKQRSRQNALRHGFLSKEAVLPNNVSGESKAEYTRFRDQILGDIQPVGAREEIAADLIVLHYWRLRRIYRYETAALRFELNRPAPTMKSEEIDYKLTLLEAVSDELEQNGFIDEEKYELLVYCYGEEKGSLARQCSFFVKRPPAGTDVQAEADSKPANPFPSNDEKREKVRSVLDSNVSIEDIAAQLWVDSKPTDPPCSNGEDRQQVLNALNIEMETLEVNLGEALGIERLNSGIRIAMLGLPREEIAERVLRHGTTNEKQLYRAMEELGRLQRARKQQ